MSGEEIGIAARPRRYAGRADRRRRHRRGRRRGHRRRSAFPGEEPTSHRLGPACGPTIITPGPDRALWFTEYRAHRIGRITTDGVIDEFDVPTPGCGPFGIAAGPDGALWFTETAADRIGRITVDGHITEFPLRPHAVTVDGDGTVWFTEWGGNRVGTTAPDGSLTVHGLPTPHSEPHGIAPGPGGALWTALEIGALARIAPADGAP
ncbi:hypothetical protein [Streptomyces sp. NPDC049915]|uniref:Vgb family protein n=1 Tax=Streptomyces sp. NPDC049915 TaxID=3155510 RepID=UPI003444AE41